MGLLVWVRNFNCLGVYLGMELLGHLVHLLHVSRNPQCFPLELYHFHTLALHKEGVQVSTPSWTFGMHFQGCGSSPVILFPDYM